MKVAQFLAIFALVLFANSSIQDVILSVQMLPHSHLSATCRLIQGLSAIFVAMLLIVTATTVKEVALIFSAINFISTLDDVGVKSS